VPARRFFVEGVRHEGAVVEIGGGDAHKILRVLRLGDGDTIEIIDSAGTLFAATIAASGETLVRATLLEAAAAGGEPPRESALQIDVAQGVPKGQKMDFIVEKATELGAAAILPFYSERTIVEHLGTGKLERWRRLAKTAAQQCGRRSVPEVHDTFHFEALLARFGDYDTVLFPWELAPHAPLRDRLPQLLEGARRALIVIGPEGGFTHDEAESARERGAELLWLGPRILRTETAAMALLAVIDALAVSL
jgi:16S rRNA (uracil1498-N3)-methyltransferase